MNGGRIFHDVSFTRTQSGTVGISRTVRRLFAELERLGYAPVPVAFHSQGFRRVEPAEAPSTGAARSQNPLLKLVSSSFFRKVATLALHVPWALLSRAWGVASTRIFNGMTRNAEPVKFAPGDLLLLCDASWNYEAWIPVERARTQGAKVLLLVYDLIPIRYPQFCYRLTTLIFDYWLKQMLPRCDAVICISKATQDEVADWIARQAMARSPALGYFHLGSDLNACVTGSDRLRAFFTAGTPSFISVGSIEPRKNHEQLLNAFERLWAGGSSARLLIAGKPTVDCQRLVRRLADHSESGARLMTLFDASDGEISYAYRQCKALVFPSLAEGFGLPLVEARACGCRVLASDLPVFREFADEGVRFFAAGSADALELAIRAELERPSGEPVPKARLLSWAASGSEFAAVASRLLAA